MPQSSDALANSDTLADAKNPLTMRFGAETPLSGTRQPPPAQIARETHNETSWSQPQPGIRIFFKFGARHYNHHEHSTGFAFHRSFAPVAWNFRVCSIFRIGSLWTVIIRSNDSHGPCRRRSGKAGGDAGGDQEQHRHGYAGDVAVERERRANMRGVGRMERHPADQRYRDH